MHVTHTVYITRSMMTNKANKTYSLLELTNPLLVLQPLCLYGLIVKIMPFIYETNLFHIQFQQEALLKQY